MSISIVSNNITTLLNTTERVSITVQDASVDPAVPVDPYDLKLAVTGIGGDIRLYDTWPDPNNRIVRSSVGTFYVDFGPPTAELAATFVSGVTTLSITDAVPPETAAWPATGQITLDYGNADYSETVNYTNLSLTGGSGSMVLASPTTKSHVIGASLKGPLRETSGLEDILFDWRIQTAPSSQIVHSIQKMSIVSHRAMSFIPELRLMIDKSRKKTSSEDDCFLGYTDSMLVSFLEGGLQNINAYQPSLNFTMENFPLEYKPILIDASLITGVMSQQLYAIDTDIPNYNDQGTAFVITHQTQLASFLNQITARLDRLIPMMKLQLLNPGSLHIQMGPSFRLQTLMSAAPQGAIFRGVYFKG